MRALCVMCHIVCEVLCVMYRGMNRQLTVLHLRGEPHPLGHTWATCKARVPLDFAQTGGEVARAT